MKPDTPTAMDCNVLADVAEYWSAANQRRLLIRTCLACHKIHYYPRAVCPHCLSEELHWAESPGLGEIYSYSTMAIDGNAHTLAYVTLDEGIVMMTNIVECDPTALDVGQRVKVVFVRSSGGQCVPMFSPA